MRILIADDHEAVRKGVGIILSVQPELEICGEAANGQEALQKTKTLHPDLIILDITMPILNGLDAAREIRKISPETPIIMLSMHESKQFVEEAKKLSVNGYVAKNQAGATLLRAIDTVLDNKMFYPALN